MTSVSRIVACAAALVAAFAASPVSAQYANEFSIAKVTNRANPTQEVAGSGTVTVQVQVNADGTHKAIKVLNSTNPGDNAAAMEIAQNSTYRPAHRGTTPVTSFYDFKLKFNGKSVSSQGEEASGGAAAGIEGQIRGGHYAQAVSQANAALLSTPGDPQVLQLLGVAQFYNNDYAASAQAFSKVDKIDKKFADLAAQAFAGDAVQLSPTNPEQSLTYAQRAVSLQNSSNSEFALGVAQNANKQYAAAIATLKPIRNSATDGKTKIAIDRQLLTAYLATNDQAGVTATASDLKTLDPSGNSAALAIGNHYLQLGTDAMTAKNFPDAVKDFDQAAAAGDPKVAVTANYLAAFSIVRMDKPDYAKARDYAMKAVTADPNDAAANFAAGISWTGVYASSKKPDDKTQALTYLNKADQLAKAAGNVGLSLQVENQIKAMPQ